jgi:TRAP transporter TAXI family solute receptor
VKGKPVLGLSRRQLIKGLAAIVCIVAISWLALDYFIPAPPTEFTIATSFKGGHYVAVGRRYQKILERFHVKVDLRSTDGAVENLKLLQDPTSGIQVGIMQGGVSNGRLAPDLLSLGRIDYQVFWLFYRATETFDSVRQFKGKRIALGPPGSGTRAVSEKILNIAGINYDNTTLLTLAAQGAVNALNDGKIDALFLTFAPDSPILISLLENLN